MKYQEEKNAPESDGNPNLYSAENEIEANQDFIEQEDPTAHKKSRGGSRSKGGAAYYYGKGEIPYSAPYYSSSSYGSTGPGYYYGQSGSGSPGYYYGQGDNNNNEQEDSLLGPLSAKRILRVLLLKWPTLIVAIVIALILGFIYFKATPKVYKASSIIEINIRPMRVLNTEDTLVDNPNEQGTTQEIFSTRLATLKSMRVIKLVVETIRTDYNYTALKNQSDEELCNMLKGIVEFEIQRQSRLCVISVKHTSPEIAQAIANAYSKTAEAFSKDENKDIVESSVRWLIEKKEQSERELANARNEGLKYRQKNQIDPMLAELESLKQTHSQLSIDLVAAETKLNAETELLSTLIKIIQTENKNHSIPSGTPRAEEILEAQKNLQNAETEKNSALAKYKADHPDIKKIEVQIESYKKQYLDALNRAQAAAKSNRDLAEKDVAYIRQRLTANFAKQQQYSAEIAKNESNMKQLDFAIETAAEKYVQINQQLEKARLLMEESLATVRPIEDAALPTQQYSPNPTIVFSVAPALGLILGIIIVLAVDRMEDHITGSDEIRRRMNTSVLGLIPRIPRTKRVQLALLSATKKFSRIAEAFAGLRGLLESPRYSNVSKVILLISTQPEEGKTITASNLALSFAMSGKKTLLVDFDLRRPRIARIYDVADKLNESNSLIDVLDKQDDYSFDGVTIDSGFDNLDLVVSAVSNSISPTNVIGADKTRAFFEWARANYEHIVIDSSPFGLVSDAIRLGTFADSAIIVCRPHKSRFGLVQHAITELRDSGSNVIGVVVNEVNFNQANSFTANSYTSYSNYSKYGKYGGRYGYGYGSYYKRTAKDDITTIPTHQSDNAQEEQAANTSELDLDGEDEE